MGGWVSSFVSALMLVGEEYSFFGPSTWMTLIVEAVIQFILVIVWQQY
jgi:hypothetical protein